MNHYRFALFRDFSVKKRGTKINHIIREFKFKKKSAQEINIYDEGMWRNFIFSEFIYSVYLESATSRRLKHYIIYKGFVV